MKMNHRNDVILWTLDLYGQETLPDAWLELPDEAERAGRWRLWRKHPSPRHRLALAWSEDDGELIRRGVSI
jgi:hypothetical protein